MIKSGTSKRRSSDVNKEEKHELLSRRQRLNHIYDSESIKEILYDESDEAEDFHLFEEEE